MSEDYTNLKYELIPYDNFVGSDAFDFNKTIYDLNSQIELLSRYIFMNGWNIRICFQTIFSLKKRTITMEQL